MKFENVHYDMVAMYVRHKGNQDGIWNDLKAKYEPTEEEMQIAAKYEETHDIATIIDNNYPSFLKALSSPPIVIEPVKLLEFIAQHNDDIIDFCHYANIFDEIF